MGKAQLQGRLEGSRTVFYLLDTLIDTHVSKAMLEKVVWKYCSMIYCSLLCDKIQHIVYFTTTLYTELNLT